jgi:hypothetical protein
MGERSSRMETRLWEASVPDIETGVEAVVGVDASDGVRFEMSISSKIVDPL